MASQLLIKDFMYRGLKRVSLLFCGFFYAPMLLAETEKAGQATTSVRQSIDTGESILSVITSLIVVLFLIFAFVWIMKRMGAGGFKQNQSLRVVGGLSMGTRERIVLVQVGDQQLLLGVAPGRVNTLHVLDQPVHSQDAELQSDVSFAERFKSALSGKIK